MANTNYLKEIECWVRDNWLPQRFPNHRFTKKVLMLSTGGNHEFDAVSQDDNVVTGIKTHSWRTSGGKRPAGKIAQLYQELYFLSLVKAGRKYLILTNGDTYKNFRNESLGKIASGVEILFCQLPDEMQKKVAEVQEEASREQK